jgi:hypothetical protein
LQKELLQRSRDIETLADYLLAHFQRVIDSDGIQAGRPNFQECRDLFDESELLRPEDAKRSRSEILTSLAQMAYHLDDHSESYYLWNEANKSRIELAEDTGSASYENERLAYYKEWIADLGRTTG